jgi:hypothetical protein
MPATVRRTSAAFAVPDRLIAMRSTDCRSMVMHPRLRRAATSSAAPTSRNTLLDVEADGEGELRAGQQDRVCSRHANLARLPAGAI